MNIWDLYNVYKGLVSCKDNGSLMENMDKVSTVPKWMLINQTKIPQMPQNLCAQAQKFGILMKKGFIGRP
jgi:hypothetical protein